MAKQAAVPGKAAATRIYRVTDTKANPAATYLVEAQNQAHALRIVTAPRFTIDVPNGQPIIEAMRAGVEVLTGEAA